MSIGSKGNGGIADPKGLRARLIGSHFATITAGQTLDIDWQINQLSWIGVNKEMYFDGIQYFAKNAEIGDSIKFQVVDVDGLTYPAGTILEEFGHVYVIPDKEIKIILYKAKMPAGMYIRVKYESIGSTNVKIICNLFRHLNEKKDV